MSYEYFVYAQVTTKHTIADPSSYPLPLWKYLSVRGCLTSLSFRVMHIGIGLAYVNMTREISIAGFIPHVSFGLIYRQRNLWRQ